jgi:hypothetical protein
MAKASTTQSVRTFNKKAKKRGKYSKKASSNKNSKNYKKPYRGQGR